MKIVYVGNFTQRHCTEVHLALTLEDMGHEVIRMQEDPAEDVRLSKLIDTGEFDLFLFTRTWNNLVKLEHILRMRDKNIPTVSYHLDLYVGLKREDGLDNDPFWRTDFVFSPDGDPASEKVFKQKGINHFWMKPGVFKGEAYMAEPQGRELGNDAKWDESFKYDVLFVGTGGPPGHPRQYGHEEWPYRGELIQWLMDTYGDRFKKFGDPDPTIRNEELNQLYADSKVVIGDSLCPGFNKPNYWSDRAYETLGRGGFLIHPFIQGMEEEFVDGKHLLFYKYGNFDQLKELIDSYLENDSAREKIRRWGHEFVKENATYHNRLQQMFDTVRAAGVVFQTATPAAPAAPTKINLGAGREPDEGWVNVDLLDLPGIDVVHNLLRLPYPFKDESAEYIKAIDLLEHLPNYTPDNKPTAIAFVEECWRILKPGGTLHIQVPHWNSPNMWIDPTHVRGFDPKSFDYFDPDTDFGKWYGYYSDKKFKVKVSEDNGNITFIMEKR